MNKITYSQPGNPLSWDAAGTALPFRFASHKDAKLAETLLNDYLAEFNRLHALNAKLLELLGDIEKHLSGGGAVRPGSLIFAEDKAAVDVIRAAISKATGT